MLHRVGSKGRVIACAAVLVFVAGCGSSGGDSKNHRPPGSTATTTSTTATTTTDTATTTTTAPKVDHGLISFEKGVFGADERLALFDPATKAVKPVPGGERGYYARFSRDGSMLVWSRLRKDQKGTDGILVQDLRTGKTRKVAADGGCPGFAPDGRSVVVGAKRIHLDSGKADALAGPKEGCRIELDDGRFIHTYYDEKIDLLDGAKVTTIFQLPGCRLDTASLSPDGSKLAFIRECEAKGDYGVTVMDIDGSNAKSIADGNSYGTAWSPDGKSIVTAHADKDEKVATLWILDAAGKGTPKKVQPGPVNTPTWGPTAPTN